MINCLHSGRLGDIICGLKACQKISERHDGTKIKLFIKHQEAKGAESDYYTQLKDLVAVQPYIGEVAPFTATDDASYQTLAIDYNLDNFRSINPWKNHVILCHLRGLNLPENGWNEPWLTVPSKKTPNGKPFVFIQRTFRYRNPKVDWKKYISIWEKGYPEEIYFFGLESEYNNFKATIYPNIKYQKVENMLEMAEYMNGAGIVALNQTVGDALTWAMGKEHYLELHELHRDTVLIKRLEEIIM